MRTHSLEIVEALFARDYRILHLAGHGVYQYEVEQDQTKKKSDTVDPGNENKSKKKKVSGMVIGTNVFLTPAEVEQMRQTPELVFINCCHLGKIEGDALDTDRKTRHLLPPIWPHSSSAWAFARWSRQDGRSMTQTFAREFYTQLLDGRHLAGRLTGSQRGYENYGSVNTWGHSVLWRSFLRLMADDISTNGTDNTTFDFVTPNEAYIAIGNIVTEAKRQARQVSKICNNSLLS